MVVTTPANQGDDHHEDEDKNDDLKQWS